MTSPGFEDGVVDCSEVWSGEDVVADCDGEITLSEDEVPALLCSPVLLLLDGGGAELCVLSEEDG